LISATITDADTPSRVFGNYYVAFFNFIVNDQLIRYPESGGIQAPLGTQIQLPDNFRITTIEYDKLTISAFFQDYSLCLYRNPLGLPGTCTASFYIPIVNGYNAADNFGQGVHTYTASGIGWEPIRGSHRMSIQITYQVDVSDIE
jgi:hypothetical protein